MGFPATTGADFLPYLIIDKAGSGSPLQPAEEVGWGSAAGSAPSLQLAGRAG